MTKNENMRRKKKESEELPRKARKRPAIRSGQKKRPLIIGLTGGVASGKSTVARMLEEYDGVVIDADAIAHEVLASRAVVRKLKSGWGAEFFRENGEPDRRKIGAAVFNDPAKLEELSAWVHPPVRKKMKKIIDKALKDSGVSFIIIDAPLLIEARLDSWCDKILFIEADSSQRTKRARSSRGWPDREIQRRELAQASLSEKRKRANTIIDNTSSPDETRAQVERLVHQWLQVIPSSTISRQRLSGGKKNHG